MSTTIRQACLELILAYLVPITGSMSQEFDTPFARRLHMQTLHLKLQVFKRKNSFN